MTAIEGAAADEHAEVWLTPDQLASWLSVVRLITRLPWAIEAQPGHVAHVRQLVIDNLPPERLRRLGQDADRIVGRIDSPVR
jgi:hypothetical protein